MGDRCASFIGERPGGLRLAAIDDYSSALQRCCFGSLCSAESPDSAVSMYCVSDTIVAILFKEAQTLCIKLRSPETPQSASGSVYLRVIPSATRNLLGHSAIVGR